MPLSVPLWATIAPGTSMLGLFIAALFEGVGGDGAIFTPDGNGSADVAEDANLGMLMIARCEIMFDITKRQSDASKWPQEKKELTDRVVKSTQALVDKMKL